MFLDLVAGNTSEHSVLVLEPAPFSSHIVQCHLITPIHGVGWSPAGVLASASLLMLSCLL
uniref:Uncharacterized protein n=1 Tax=Arundo donax TaxID=35708 RepID=A0A0A9HLQ9_ARUDO